MPLIKYGCKGSCGTVISEEEFNNGKHVCMTDGCTHLGQPFQKKLICEKCGADYFAEEGHQCNF